jgi:DNA-binding transcriptional LysR family regulator
MWYSPSLQQLLFLEAVLEEGSLVRAADRLHTTHSTISRRLKALTTGLGINHFDKTPRGLKPSSIGRVYSTQIRRSLEQARLTFDLVRYGANLHRRPFYVGHSTYIHGSLLPLLEQLTLPGSEAPLCRTCRRSCAHSPVCISISAAQRTFQTPHRHLEPC